MPKSQPKHRFAHDSADVVWIDVDGIRATTEKAIAFQVNGGEVLWIPRSVIVDHNEEHVGVKKWFAEKNGIEGDW